jgi:putative glutamine amidotransferase
VDSKSAGASLDRRIAITALKRRDEALGRIPTDYVTALELVGGIPVVLSTFDLEADEEIPDDLDVHLPISPDDASMLDSVGALVLSGGGDVDPSLFGERPHPRTYNITPRRDRFEITLVNEALRRDMPVLAICRGMQVLNVALGGTLEQNLADRPHRLAHDRDRPRAEPAHHLRMKERSLLARLLGSPRGEVNSHHHQGLGVVASPLEEVAWAEDGVLEAVVSGQHRWVVGVQWHPECMVPLDERQMALFRGLVDAARAYAGAVSVRSA